MLVRRADSNVNAAVADRAGGAYGDSHADPGTNADAGADADDCADVDARANVDPRADVHAAPDGAAASYCAAARLADGDANGRAHGGAHGHIAARAANVAATTRPDGYLASHGDGYRYTDTGTDGHAHGGGAVGAWMGVHRGGRGPMGVRRRGLCGQARYGTLDVYGRA